MKKKQKSRKSDESGRLHKQEEWVIITDMKRIIDYIMAGGGLGLMLLASAIKFQKFGGEQFNFSSNETTIMLVAGVLVFILASASLRNGRKR
ncbi:MAG: hypothetical protein PHS19_04890 [Eubacteriales bacterium]|nr:hypothetical protein [Eubacteriales bacterium]